MKQKYEVLMMYTREHRSFREISRRLGIHRETVSKYVREYEDKREKLMKGNKDVEVETLIESLVEKPQYKSGPRLKSKCTPEVEKLLKQYLLENQEKVKKGQRKQKKTIQDMYEALLEEGMDISYGTVHRAVRQIMKKTKEAFLKESYLPGDICEFDWGEVKLTIEGRLQTFQMAVFTSAFGNYRWACLFPKQTTECFQEAHAEFFAYINGVYSTIVYDNMRVAIKRFVGQEKEPTEGLMQLSLYYGFGFRFCNIRRGNEKGHVERSVDVIRRKAFAFRDTFESLEEANQYLLSRCQKLNDKPMTIYQQQTPAQRLEQERSQLLAVPLKWDAARIIHGRIDKYATVIIDQNRYSVPDHLVGEMVMVKVYTEKIRCYFQEKLVAEHRRLYGNHEWRLELNHVLPTLRKKPGALANSLALQQAEQKIQNIYYDYYIGKEKDFIELLTYWREKENEDDIFRSIAELEKIHPQHVTTDKIKILCAGYREPPIALNAKTSETKEIAAQARAQLRGYDALFQIFSTDSEVVT